MKKYIAIILVLTFSILFFFQIEMVRNFAKKTLPNSIKTDIKEFIFGKERWEEFKKLKKYGDMNYNKKLLPKTQFTIINFREIPLVGLNLEGISHYNKLFRNRSSIKFFLEKFYDGILLVDAKGKIFFIENSSFQYSDQFKWNKIDSNLTSNNIYEVLDILTIDDEIYISFSEAKS